MSAIEVLYLGHSPRGGGKSQTLADIRVLGVGVKYWDAQGGDLSQNFPIPSPCPEYSNIS